MTHLAQGERTHVTHPTTITAESGLPFVDIVREFDAPAEAVFRAHTEPDLYTAWLGPRNSSIRLVEFNATPGGRWKYAFTGGDNMEFSFFGVFHTVEPNTL